MVEAVNLTKTRILANMWFQNGFKNRGTGWKYKTANWFTVTVSLIKTNKTRVRFFGRFYGFLPNIQFLKRASAQAYP